MSAAVAHPVPAEDGAVFPPGYRERMVAELRRRHEVLTAAEASEEARVLAVAAVGADVRLFVDDWVWTYDPRLAPLRLPATVPFRLRPRQAEYLTWLEERERTQTDGLVEKSRDEGFSFLTLAFMLHRWLTLPGWAGAVGSRKQDLVDAIGDPKALLPKVRTMLYLLPPWMLDAFAPGYRRERHDNFLRLTNPAKGSTITGEAGDNMGRGGRASLYMIDEWAFVEHPEAVEAATSQTARVRIKGSTPAGVGDRFYVDRFSGRFPVFTFHWRDNPDKNWSELRVDPATGKATAVHPWYEAQKAKLDPVTLAQEVDIDYTAAAEGVVIPAAWVRAAVVAAERLGLQPTGRAAAGLDVAEEGADLTVFASGRGPVVGRVAVVRGTPGEQPGEVDRLCREDGVAVLRYDRLGVGALVTATLKHREGALPYRVVGVANGERPSLRRFEDRPEATAAERFADRAAELWWALRLRFQRTYERVEGLALAPAEAERLGIPATGTLALRVHADEDCIAIPDDPTLVAQLSQPTYAKDSRDKIRVNKKGKGTASPNHAEALLYLFADDREDAAAILPPGTTFGGITGSTPPGAPATGPSRPPLIGF